MARLDPLIKVRKHAVEEKQRTLAALYRQQEQYQAQIDQMLLDLAREEALVLADLTNLEARTWMGRYRTGVHAKIAALEGLIKKLETRILIATDDVRTAFADMKKIEITARERKKKEKKALDDKIAADLDERALEIFRRDRDDKTR